jgi:hypothetical protein
MIHFALVIGSAAGCWGLTSDFAGFFEEYACKLLNAINSAT